MSLRALARVNVAAVERNVARLRTELSSATALCAVVKADGYGHGAAPSADAALRAGASSLAVATADEAAQLRAAGIDARILVMGAISFDEVPVALAARAELVAWSESFIAELLQAAGAAPASAPIGVHVKLDTGMGRLGTRSRTDALAVAAAASGASPALRLAGAMTHFATADDDPEFLAAQLELFRPFVSELRRVAPGIVAHAANSAATLVSHASHLDMVRCGIAIYGCDPLHEDPSLRGLEAALELTSYLAAVKRTEPGETVGYGRQFTAEVETWIGTIPIGYADGIRRAFTNDCDVLIGGARYPLVGAVSMDNVTVDLGRSPTAAVGAQVTFIGRDGGERQSAEQLARRIETINYEIVSGISARVPRQYHRDGTPYERAARVNGDPA